MKAKTIEYLGVLLCNWLLSSCDKAVQKVKVQIDKPAAIKEAKFATVITKRERSPAAGASSSASQSSASSSSLSYNQSRTTGLSSKVGNITLKPSLFDVLGVDYCGVPQLPLATKSTKATVSPANLTYLAIGSNVGCRSRNIHLAIDKVRAIANVRHISFLYETPAAYVTEQPAFLNCAISVETSLDPQSLLTELKRIEAEVGRQPTFQYGPRVIDLDIISMGSTIVNDANLVIPHALMHERAFVLVPLADICPSTWIHPQLRKSFVQLFSELSVSDVASVKRVIPSHGDNDQEVLLEVQDGSKVRFFGILNATPDSFSDGGVNLEAKSAAKNAQRMIEADDTVILDIGGESTRPNSVAVSMEEELARIEPVISAAKTVIKHPSKTLISVDTNKPVVAKQALEHWGCHILNDVYTTSRFYSDRASHDDMCQLIRSTRKIWVTMHCRGTSENMKSLAIYDAGQVVKSVVGETIPVIRSILESGVLPWQLVVDPGIGFAKNGEHSIELLRHISDFKSQLGYLPVLVGASRKKFIGTILGRDDDAAESRDVPGLALIPPLISSGTNFIRLHDIPSAHQVRTVYDAIWRDPTP